MTASPSESAPGSACGAPDLASAAAGVADRRVADVVVVGAGPAGLSAAVAAADAGATVVLVDAEPTVGGQFWRHPAPPRRVDDPGTRHDASSRSRLGAVGDALRDGDVATLHHDLRHYRRLRRRLAGHMAAGMLEHLAGHEVWAVERIPDPDAGVALARFAVRATTAGPSARRGVMVRARSLVLATGAYDLQVPFPGWDLPGVMTAGGVQSLLKGHAVLAGRRVVVAGTGPFLASVASGLVRSGATVPGVFDAASPTAWLREPRALLAARRKLTEGAGYARDLLRHRAGYHTGWTVVSADGAGRLETVTVAPLDSAGTPVTDRSRRIAADVLAVGWGFVPQLDLPLALGCGTVAGGDGLPVVLVDSDQRSTVPGVFAAGEICGVGGAALAAIEGEIAGAAAAEELLGAPAEELLGGRPDGLAEPERRASGRRRVLDRRRAALRTFATALQRAYPVPDCWIGGVRDDTVVCRCEEVTAGAIRDVARQDGVADARTAKLLVRPGMGWCQGRICGYATDCLIASAAGTAPEHRPVERSVAVPVPLGMIGSVRRIDHPR